LVALRRFVDGPESETSDSVSEGILRDSGEAERGGEGLGVPLGVPLGVALGVAFGVAFGVVFGVPFFDLVFCAGVAAAT
jgi:hypothetical protein